MKLIEATGSYFNIGRTIGRETKPLMARSILNYKKYFQQITHHSLKEALRIAKQYWPAAKKYTPESWAMMEGLAAGAGINFELVFLINALEEVEFALGHRVEKCTSLVAKSSAGVFLGHNEDWYKFDAESSYVTKITYPSGIVSIGPNYSCLLPVRGINSAGFALSDDTVIANDEKIGIPRVCLMRNALEATSINEAMKIVTHQERAGCYHYYFAKGQRVVSFETSATRKVTVPLVKEKNREYALHNNCFLHPELCFLDPSKPAEIKAECDIQKRAQNLLKETKKLDLKNLMTIFKTHPGVCNHAKNDYKSGTINSFIADVTKKEIWIGQGRACQTEYHKFTF